MIGIDFVAMNDTGIRCKVCDDLMTEKIEVHPFGRTSAFAASENATVKFARFVQITDRKCQMKKVHFVFSICLIDPR